jgi:hypothetical protein
MATFQLLLTLDFCWREMTPPEMYEAAKLQEGETKEEGEQKAQSYRELELHSAALAASCTYLRGLWAGGFREALEPNLTLDGPDATRFPLLVNAIYGERVEFTSMDDGLNFFRFLQWRLSMQSIASSARSSAACRKQQALT